MSLITWSTTDISSTVSLSDNNLTVNTGTTLGRIVRATEGKINGKWYFELVRNVAGDVGEVGFAQINIPLNTDVRLDARKRGYRPNSGNKTSTTNLSGDSWGNGLAIGEILGISIDFSTGILELFKNGTSMGVIFNDILNLATPLYPYALSSSTTGTRLMITANFGAIPFAYAMPQGCLPYDLEIAKQNWFIKNKHLIKSSNKIQVLIDNVWTDTLLSELLTKSNFETHGMDDISTIPYEKWMELDDEFEVITWTDDTTVPKLLEINTDSFSPIEKLNQNGFEVITWTDSTDAPKLELGIPPQKPLYWFDNPTLLTWTDSPNDLQIEQRVTVEQKARFLISKDGRNTWYTFKNNAWNLTTLGEIATTGMSKNELQAITQSQWSEWFVRGTIDFAVNISGINQYGGNPVSVKNITVNFPPNQAPVIINPVISNDEIHNEYTTITAIFKDIEGDTMQYRVLIKKANEEEFYVANDWDNIPNNFNMLRAYNHPYFNLGLNIIRVQVRDSRGASTHWDGNLVLTNQIPMINYSYTEFGFNATISDPDTDKVAIQVSINNNIILPFGEFMTTPRQFKYEWDTKHTPFGQPSTIKIELKDSFGGQCSEEFTIIGTYKGLLFLDKDGNYYTSDKGDILKMLNKGTLIAGQNSEPVKIRLLNKTNSSLQMIKIIPDSGNLPDNATIKLSETEEFLPKHIIEIFDIMNNGDEKEFYVSIRTTPGKGVMGGNFSITAEGKLIN